MTIRNRELSQFGSFIYITDDTKNIGIATQSLPYVGIGTTNPQRKLHVVGDIQIDGDLFYQGNLEFGNVDLNTTGIITASAFFNPQGEQLIGFDSWSKTNSTIYRLSNVGIGTTNPTEKLDVLGNINVVGNVGASGQFISSITGTFTTGTAPLNVASRRLVTNLNCDYLRGGEPGGSAAGDIVTINATQTLTNKTLTSPSISNPTLTNPIVSGSINFGTATLSGPASGIHTLTLPAESGTLLTSSSGGVITGLVTTGNIQNGTILNEDIENTTIQNAKLVNSTISGVSLGSNLNSLTAGSFITYSSGSTYNGSSAVTVSVNASTANDGSTLVARNPSGDFSAGTVSVLNLTASQTIQANNFSITNLSATNGNFSGIVTATDFNSTSDENLKENISTYENALKTLHNLRGVHFTWKESQKPSIGVIAQELEEVLPELVNNGAVKSVNYNGIIGVLIEAVKELSEEVKELKKHINN
jgi:hypothetical protein